ncbi:hypothetical protein [Brucella lupini]|uniref:Uncharacterized protein n=1 Tax=Brucella lupini TaxID=255457 RepID=A0A256H0N9_9HYPH|nr:hypothetical protein [Brucella lupini]KAB2699924.1 hypothetical protein F9L03_24965 [Brucella lupini]OYR32997.1 hypothetical protein CES86_5305 [Brucella lupini]
MSQFGAFFGSNAAVGKQLLWEHTIFQVALLFAEAERRIRSSEGQAKYTSLDGWWRKSSHRINGTHGYRVPEETAISEALRDEMENAKRDLMLRRAALGPEVADIDSLEFHTEAPRRQKTGIGRKAKPTDFRFYRSGLGDIELRIEAKVIVKDKDITDQYLSLHGLGRFSDPKEPYTDELVGGMVAYTVTDDRGAWSKKIDAGMAAATPVIPTFHHSLPQEGGDTTLFCRVPYTHAKFPPQAEVLVFHLVLEFDCHPEAR